MKRINLNEVLWLFILGGFVLYIGSLLYTGDIINFINPRIVKYSFWGLAGISILWIYQLGRIYTSDRGQIRIGYLVFILPLILGYIVKPGALNSSIVKSKGVNLTCPGNIVHEAHLEVPTEKQIVFMDGTLEIGDENFLAVMDDMERNKGKYRGKSVVITGFVIKDYGFGGNEFAVGKIIMECCAADSEVSGLLASGEEAGLLQAGDWVRVAGRIDYVENTPKYARKASIVPVIKIDKVDKVPEPKNHYIYQ